MDYRRQTSDGTCENRPLRDIFIGAYIDIGCYFSRFAVDICQTGLRSIERITGFDAGRTVREVIVVVFPGQIVIIFRGRVGNLHNEYRCPLNPRSNSFR